VTVGLRAVTMAYDLSARESWRATVRTLWRLATRYARFYARMTEWKRLVNVVIMRYMALHKRMNR